MSSIDKRVVQMVFDNDKFEKNIEQSRKSLEKMDKTLDEVANNTNVERLGTTIGDSLEQGVDKGIIKAEALRTVINTVVGSISSTVLGALHNIQSTINNLTFDQIGAGLDKYEKKLESVQTILSATAKSGETLESVEETMEKLMWYTDETSYNFSDMANNIGKFTAVGVELETASSAMQGIANWAGLAGQKAQSASRAMYNISQAMSAGYMKQQDWASIQNANMDTKEFRETAYKTAKELAEAGKYTELSLEWFDKNTYNDFFADLGKNKNFTTDVLIETLKKFSFYSDEIRRITEDENKTTIKAMDILGEISEDQVNELKKVYDEFGDGSEALQKEAMALGVSVETAANIAKAGWETFDLGRRAFEASQQYTTFTDVIDATTDAVSSLWMKIDQQIFGNLEEAKEFWTELGDIFYNIFATPVEKILEVFEAWNEFSGRKILLGIAEDGEKVVSVFEQIVKNLSSVVDRIKEAFFEVNPFFEDSEQMGAALAYATNKLREFLKTLQPTRQELLIVKDAFAFAFRILNGIFKVGYSIVKGAQIIVKAILPNMSELAKSLLPVFNELNERGDDINKLFIDISNSIYRIAYFIAKVITKFKESLMNGTIKDFLVDLGKFLIAYAIYIIDKIIHPVEEEMTGIPLLLYKVGTKVLEILRVIINVVANIVVPITANLIIAVLEFLNSGIGQKIITFLDLLVRTVFSLFTLIVNVGITILEIINKIATEINKLFDNTAKQEKEFDKNTFIGGLSVALGVLMMIIGNFMEEYKKGNGNKVLEQLSDVFEKLGNAVDSFQRSINSVALKNIAKSVVMLAAAMMVIAFIPQDRLISSFAIVTIAVSGMLAVMLAISKSVGNGRSIKDILDFSKSLKALAGALTLISLNIRIMSKESLSTYGKGLLIVAGEMILVAQFVVMIMNATEPMKGVDVEAYKIQVQNIGKMFGIILALSVAMIAFSAAIKLIGSMNVDQLIIGLVGYFASIVGLIWVIREISKFFDNTAVLENFTKKIVALTGSIVMMVGAIIALMVPILIFGIVPQNVVMDGLIDVILELAVLLIAFDFVSKQTKSIDVKGLFALIALIGVLVISVNALLGAFTVFALTPTDQFDKAISGIKSLILVLGAAALALDFVFVILPKLLFKMEQTREFEIISDRQAHAWANDFVRLGAALIMMAVAVGILAKATKLLAETSKNFDINAAFWTVVKLLIAIDGFLILQEILQRFIFKDPELGKTMLLYALQITAIAGAIAALAYAFDKFANTIDENKIDSALKKMGKSIVIVMGGILLVVAIVAILGKILQGRRTIGGFAGGGITKYLALPGPKGNNGEERVEKTTMSLTKEIVLFAAALMSFSLALSAMMLPIFVLSGDTISEDDFKKASKRLVLLAAGLAGFIGALMLLYGLMGWITGGKAYGLSKKTTKNNIDLRGSIFGKNEFASRVSEMKGFGQNIAEMSKSLLMIVGSIFTLMLPLKILGGLNKNEFQQGLEGVVEMLLVVALSLSIMSLSMADFSTAKVFGIGIIMLAIFGVLTTILIKFQEVQQIVEMLKPAITVLTVISAVNAVLLIINKIRELIKKFKSGDDEEEEEDAIDKFKRIVETIADNIIKIAAGFAIISAGVGIIAFSLKEMSTVSLSWQQIAELASFVVGIGAFLAILGKMSTRKSAKKAEKETETTEVVIDETTSVLTVIGDTIGDASEETEEIAEDAESIADNMMKIAGAFDIMAAGLVIIVGAFKLMETVKLTPGQIALLSAYAAVIAGYLIAVSLLVKDDNTVLKAAGAFGIIAASIVALAAGLKVLSTIDEIGTKAIVALSVIITIVGAIVVLFGIFGNPAMGGTLLVAAGAIAAAFVSIALSILLVSFAAKVFAKAAKLYAEAVEYLIKVAENSEEGWAAIQKGLDVFIELASIILVVVVVLGALCALWHPLAVGALLGAAAILAIAVALVGVLGLLYLIALAWPTLKDNLDDLTEWLELHEEDWSKGIGKFLADVISSVETNLKQAGLAVDGTVSIMGGSITSLLDPINQVKSAFGSILDAPDAWVKAGINSDDNIFSAMAKMVVYSSKVSGESRADLDAAKQYDKNAIDSEARHILSMAGINFDSKTKFIPVLGDWTGKESLVHGGKTGNVESAINLLNKTIREDFVPSINAQGGITKEDFDSVMLDVYKYIDIDTYERFRKNEQERNRAMDTLERVYLDAGGRLFKNGEWIQNNTNVLTKEDLDEWDKNRVTNDGVKLPNYSFKRNSNNVHFFAGIPIVDEKYAYINGEWVELVNEPDMAFNMHSIDGYEVLKYTGGVYRTGRKVEPGKYNGWDDNDSEQLADLFNQNGKLTSENIGVLSSVGEDVSSAAEAYGDGVELTDVVTSDNTEATANNTQAVKTLTMSVEDFKLKYDRSGSTYVPSQKEIEAYEGSRTRGGNVWASIANGDSKDVWSTIASIFGEGAKSYMDSDGDIFSFLTSWATSDKTGDVLTPATSKVEEGANKFLDWVNEVTGVDVKTSAMSKLQEYGLFKKKDENAENAEEEKSFLETIKDTAVSIYSGVKDGKSLGDAVKDALADNGLTLPQLEDSDLGKTLLESFGVNLYDENGELDFTKLMGDYKLPDIEKVKKELEEVAKVDTSDLNIEDQVGDVSKQIEDAYKKYDFNYDDILKKYNVDPETFQNYGTDLGESLGLGQVEGYENAIKDNFSDISKQYSDLTSDAGYSSSSTSNLVWRGYDEKEGRDLYAPAMEEFRNTLVTPIREGWIWNGWNRKSKSDPLWLPDEKTQAKMDALKKTAEAVKESTDSTAASFEERSKSLKAEGKLLDGIDKESKWLFDENTMEWTLVDKNGKPITKEDMEGNVSNVTKAGTKIGSKYGVNDSILKNGVWVYDEKNDEWTLFDSKTNKEMLTKTGDEGFIITRKNPELKKSEYAVLKNREDLDMTKGVRKFDYKDSAGLPQKISDNKGHLYDAYGRKVKGYDNRYALTDKNGNLITGKNGNRIEFEVADDGTLRVLGEYNESAQIMKDTAQTCVGLMSMGLGAIAKAFADNPEAAAALLKNDTTSDAVNTAAYATGNAETTETTTQYSSVQNGDATTTTTTNTKTSTASTSTTSQQTTQDAATVADRALSNLRSMNQTLVQIKGKIDMMQENVRSTNDNTRFINNQLIEISKSESPVILDTQALVGRLLPLINQGLGQYTSLGSRRVTT